MFPAVKSAINIEQTVPFATDRSAKRRDRRRRFRQPDQPWPSATYRPVLIQSPRYRLRSRLGNAAMQTPRREEQIWELTIIDAEIR